MIGQSKVRCLLDEKRNLFGFILDTLECFVIILSKFSPFKGAASSTPVLPNTK
jgi:hypothetical protein